MGMIGKQVSRYIIESEIGRGGMGVVYKATDTTLDRTVALKFLPPMIGAADDVEARFINEAKAVSQLDHPNIAVVHEIDRTDDGQLFIVMAYYSGVTLEDRIEDGDLELEEIVDISRSIASGLHRAHDTGITHRDIKPGNVMITEHGEVKILDFGLAKVQNQTLTIGTQSLGTLAYMSPEQAQGQAVDHRTDLWALGVVMYEMLAGKRPFDGPYDAAILYSAANEDPEPVTTWRPDVPEYIAVLLAKLLEKQPANRPQNAAEIVATLKEGHAPTQSEIKRVEIEEFEPGTQDSPDGEKSRSSSPRSVTITLDPTPLVQKPWTWISLIGVLLVIGLGWVFSQGGGGTSDEDREAARAHVQTGFDHQQAREYSLAEAEYERAIDRDPDLWSAWTSYASLKNELGEYDLAVEYAQKALALNEEDAVAYFNLGIALEDSGNRAEALQVFSEAVRIDGTFIAAFSAWGNTLVRDQQYQEAIGVLERGRTASPNDPNIFLIYRNLGFAFAGLEQSEDAILYFESSLQLQPGQPTVIAELATQFEAAGNTTAALEQWARYLEIETDPIKRREAQQVIDRLSG